MNRDDREEENLFSAMIVYSDSLETVTALVYFNLHTKLRSTFHPLSILLAVNGKLEKDIKNLEKSPSTLGGKEKGCMLRAYILTYEPRIFHT